MGLTLADFISSGTVPVVMDILINNVIGVLRNSAPSFMNLAGKPSSPVLLLTPNLFNSFRIKSSVTSLIRKVFL